MLSRTLQAFFYDWIDRNGVKKGKPLPEKIGSMQLFMHGFTGLPHCPLFICHG
jgi:phosphatidylinositol 4-kinase type 2